MNAITAKYLSKDQEWSNETTTYWFLIEGDSDLSGKVFGVAESGPTSAVLDSDGAPLDYSEHDLNRVTKYCVVTDEMRMGSK